MNKLMILALATVSIGLAAPAITQDAGPKGGQGRPGAGQDLRGLPLMKQMLQKLNLTNEQKTKLQNLEKELQPKLKAIREGNGDREAKRAETRKLMEQFRKEVDQILTQEQKQQYRKLMAEWRKENGQRGGKQGGKGNKGGGTPPPSL